MVGITFMVFITFMGDTGGLSPMYVRLNALNMSIWKTEQIQLNELQWLVRSTVYVQGEYRRNPYHRLIIAG